MANAIEKFQELQMQPGERLTIDFGDAPVVDDEVSVKTGDAVALIKHTPNLGCWRFPATAVWIPDPDSISGAERVDFDIDPDAEATQIENCPVGAEASVSAKLKRA